MKTAIALLLLPACCFAAPVLNPDNGHYYEVVPVMATWADAEAAAQASTHLSVAGHLVTISDAAEQSFLDGLLASDSPNNHVHIGGVQDPGGSEPGGGWGWVTGESFTYTHWYPGEPNQYLGTNEDTIFAFAGSLTEAGQWADGIEGQERWYVVEYDVEPVSSESSSLGSAKALYR